ncbi:MAG: hypothetical protein N3A01_03225, partial [Bacteroidales bacterium]|nr:hypothetical protein [Bacteroidales bacterium]
MKIIFCVLLGFSINILTFSQHAINFSGAQAHTSAMLDVSDTTKGILIPRLSTVERNSLSNPAIGLLIYNSDSKRLNYWNGSQWVEIISLELSVSQSEGTGVVKGILFSSTDSLPHHSAILEIRDNNGGFLIPRMTTTQRNSISSPANGLLIYNTETNRFNYYNGTSWLELCGTNVGNSTGSVQAGFGISISLD